MVTVAARTNPDPCAPRRVATYRRVSTLMQARHGYSLGAQADDSRKLAESISELAHEYEDTDSGADWDLPGLNSMLDAAKRREFDVLVVPDPDRFARNMAKQLVLEEELKRSGIEMRYVYLPLDDTAESRLLKNMRSSIAEYEREKIAFRTSRAAGRRRSSD